MTIAVWQDPARVQQECVIGRYMARTAKRETGLAMKRTVAQRKDRASYSAKREKIIEAAGPVLKRYGLGGTTIEALAQGGRRRRGNNLLLLRRQGRYLPRGHPRRSRRDGHRTGGGGRQWEQSRCPASRLDASCDAGIRKALSPAVHFLHRRLIVRHRPRSEQGDRSFGRT